MFPVQNTEAEAAFLIGNECLATGNLSGAQAWFERAIDQSSDFAQAHTNLAFVLERRGAIAEAETAYRRSLAINPLIAGTWLNFGGFLFVQKRLHEAEEAYREGLLLAPPSASAWSNLGVVYASMGREQEAEQCYLAALAIDSNHRKTRFNFSYVLLRQGRWNEGWTFFEARDWSAELAARLPCPRWTGESVQGKHVLLTSEGGYGDMIQFCRYAAQLKQEGAARLTLLCRTPLKRLFETLDAVDRVVDAEEQIAHDHIDIWTPALSIPCFRQTSLQNVPATIPYLRVHPADAERWDACLPAHGMRVGLVWKGNPAFENDGDRSLPGLKTLVPLATVDGISFISLQKGAGEEEAKHPPAGFQLFDAGALLGDFADTAALMVNLDLMICVDTATAHLCGALGVPCWILLPGYKPDWRWLTERSDSPWYPGVVRLFRQAVDGDWDAVIAQVRDALVMYRSSYPPRSFAGNKISIPKSPNA